MWIANCAWCKRSGGGAQLGGVGWWGNRSSVPVELPFVSSFSVVLVRVASLRAFELLRIVMKRRKDFENTSKKTLIA